MKLELKPDIIDDGSNVSHHADHAGFTKDGLYSWIYRDSVLELIYSKTNESLAQWRFGKVINDRNTIITCVTDFDSSDGHFFLVATENLSEEGTLCLFSLSKKRVVRAIEFPRKIRAVEILFTNINDDVPSWVISKHLNFFSGLVAVGTEGGYTYLVDLCLDDVMINSTTEMQPKKLSVSSPNLIDPKAKRNAACSSDKHMAVLIDEQCHRNGQFYHRRQDDTIDKVFEEENVCVTTLKYLSQAGILAIGFNFGCFQLWRLYSPVLDYSSRFAPDSKAISRFVVQEPENDPRNLIYLWIGRDNSVMGEEHGHGKVSSISLFQLCFNKKDNYAGFGLFYEDLESVCGRLEHNLMVNPYMGGYNQTTWSSQLICAYTILNPLYTPPVSLANDSFEECSHSNDLSLSIFVWRADSKQSGHNTCYWMAIFDLNRWYHAQMPHSIRCTGQAPEVCAYWAVYKLDDVVALSFPQSLLHVQVTGNNILRFMNKSPLPPEEHSFPSSLEITDIKFVTPQKVVIGHCYGWQGYLLQELVQEGAFHLVQPANFYHQCLQARLIPQNYNESKANTVEHQRKVLLNLSLDHNLTVRLIHNCIHLWSDGDYVDAGCSLTLLLEWAWSAVIRIKEKLDSASQALYDCSGLALDPYTDWLIRRQHCGLVSLKQIFAIFLSQANPTTARGQQELEMRLEVIKLLVQHQDIVRWCLVESLLPEMKEGSTQVPNLFAYPYGELCHATRKRRAELKALKGVVTDHSLLLIDGLVRCAGPQINSIWEADEQDSFYPPPSMQALMNLFLLEDVLLEVKQAILLYLLQDLAAVLGCDEEHQTVVVSFVQSFNLLPSLVHTVQGLWFIDHRDYEEGLRQLVNPNVLPHSWSAWVDVAVVNTLLAQGQNATAAHYIHSGHCLGATLDEQKLNIAVLIRNRKVSPAVNYMRQCCYHKQDPADLMPFMMRECQGNKMIGQLLQLHLMHAEEFEVEKFLRERSEPQALEPLLLYYLTHSRFVEAFTLNEEMNKMDKLEATSLAAREKAANRNRLMEAYLRVLPDITRKLLMEKQHRPAVLSGKRVEVAKPRPLSTVVYKKDQNAISRSHLIMAVMDKVEEAMKVVEDAEIIEEPMTTVETDDKSSSVFVATPLTPRHKSFASLAITPVAVSYPESLQSTLPTNPLSAAKKELQDIHAFGDEQERQGSLSALTRECLDLLKTPLKGSSSEISPRPSIASNIVKTPQSILKVRRLSKTGKESRSIRKTPPSTGKRTKKLGFSMSDSAISSPVSPSMELRQDKKSPVLDASHASKSVTATPKQLRFVGLSPTPSPSPSPLPVNSKEYVLGLDTKMSSFVSDDESQEVNNVTAEESDVQEKEKEMEESLEEEAKMQKVSTPEKIEETVPESYRQEMQQEKSVEDMETVYMETKSSETEILEVNEQPKSFIEGPNDRYEDELGHLVRPDLQSPWKQNQSSEEEMTVDNNVTLSLTHIEDQPITPTMTSSPLEEIPTTGNDDNNVASEELDSVLPETELKDESVVKERIESTAETELHRNILQSLVAPRKSIITKTSLTSVESSEQKVVSSHIRISQSLNVDTSLLTRSLRSRGESSPEERVSREPDSPPATPPLSKRAKMMVRDREMRKSRFDFATPRKSLERELRSTKTEESSIVGKDNEEKQESESSLKLRKTPERKSTSRSVKRKASDIEEENEKKTLEQSISTCSRVFKTPERRSPGRTTKKKDEENEEDVSEKRMKEMEMQRSTRHSPSRSTKTKDEESELEDGEKPTKEMETRRSTRHSPSRSTKTKDEESELEDSEKPTKEMETRRSTRRSPSRSTKTKDEESELEDSEKPTKEMETRRSTRHSPARTTKTKDEESELEDSEKPTKEMETRRSTRHSPARTTKTKDEESEVEDGEKPTKEMETRRSTRRSPARSVKKKTAEIENEDESDANKESEANVEKRRKSPSKSAKKNSAIEANDDDTEKADVDSGTVLRLRSSPSRDKRSETPERRSPFRKSSSRAAKGRSIERENTNENVESENVLESGISRLRSSPSRDTRSKTPERKSTARKSRNLRSQVLDEENSIPEEIQSESEKGGEKIESKEEEHFIPAEEFVNKLTEEDLTPSSPSRRKSARLNTPDRAVSQSIQVESGRRLSRGRSASISLNTGDDKSVSNEKQLLESEKKLEKRSSPDKDLSALSRGRSRSPARETQERKEEQTLIEEHHNVRRSTRQSRTPERFRKENRDTANTSKRSKEMLETSLQESITVSPTRRSLRKAKSPERLSTEQIETIKQNISPQRALADAVQASLETMVEEVDDKASNTGAEEEVWSEDLPPLRLEEDLKMDIKSKGSKSTTGHNVLESQQAEETKVEFKDFSSTLKGPRILHVSKTATSKASFVFSAPLAHADHTFDASEGKAKNEDQGFVFSQPTIAKDDTLNVEQETSNAKNVTTKSKRRRKALLDSPALLPLTPEQKSAQVKKERARTRMSEVQRASANVLRRYSRQSGPVTRRLVPSTWSSDQSEEEK